MIKPLVSGMEYVEEKRHPDGWVMLPKTLFNSGSWEQRIHELEYRSDRMMTDRQHEMMEYLTKKHGFCRRVRLVAKSLLYVLFDDMGCFCIDEFGTTEPADPKMMDCKDE